LPAKLRHGVSLAVALVAELVYGGFGFLVHLALMRQFAWTIFSTADPRWRDGGMAKGLFGLLAAVARLEDQFGARPPDLRVTFDGKLVSWDHVASNDVANASCAETASNRS
jgi:hypothetical protein